MLDTIASLAAPSASVHGLLLHLVGAESAGCSPSRLIDVVIDPTAAIFDEMLVHVPGNPSPTLADVIEHLYVDLIDYFIAHEMDVINGEEAESS